MLMNLTEVTAGNREKRGRQKINTEAVAGHEGSFSIATNYGLG